MEMTRSCVRRPCDFTIEVNGTQGTLHFDYARLNELLYVPTHIVGVKFSDLRSIQA